MIDDPAPVKAALREAALRARRSLGREERARANEALIRRLLHVPEFGRARTIAFYAAMADEADPTGALAAVQRRGARTLLPRVRGLELELVRATDVLSLKLGYRGVREPAGPAVHPGVVDVALVPGVAFDLSGGRLGHGGGHYDRLLVKLEETCLRIGLAYACQIVPRVPRGPHDQPVDVIVTDTATYRPRPDDTRA